MKHHQTKRKFGLKSNQRKALLRSLLVSLIKHESIVTTEARAREIRPLVEKMITRAKTDNLFNRRILISRLGSSHQQEVEKLFSSLAKRFADVPGGYVRVVKLPQRAGDASPMAVIQFVK